MYFIDWFSGSWWTFFDAIITIGTLVVVLNSYYKNTGELKKQNEEIKIYFQIKETKEKIDTKLKIIRKHFTRGELLGVLGMIQNNSGNRFNLEELKNRDFLDEIIDVQNGEDDKITIFLSREEYNTYFKKGDNDGI